MLPPRQPPRTGVLHTSLSLLPADGSNSPTESGSSRETWPTADALMLSKQLDREKFKECENASAVAAYEHSVIRHILSFDKMSIRDISKGKVDVITEQMHRLPGDFLDKLKNELRGLIEGMGGHQHREEYIFLQRMVLSRADLTEKTLLMAHRGQLEILVAIKTGIQAFLHPTVSLSQASLIDNFLYRMCGNIACGNQIPADNCTCEIWSKRNGFCNLCMCVICSKYISSIRKRLPSRLLGHSRVGSTCSSLIIKDSGHLLIISLIFSIFFCTKVLFCCNISLILAS